MVTQPSLRVKRARIGESLSGRHNSLNFLRLVLALAVLVDHAVGLGGFFGDEWTLNDNSIGTIAVSGFFGISGFLIAGSAMRNGAGRYLWQRFLRIFPGVWICLILTAFVFGVIGWLTHPVIPHCGLSCYFKSNDGPFSYLYRNWLLPNQYLKQYPIAGTPSGVPFTLIWNGSLWTLFYEFLCYLMLMVLALAGLLRQRYLTLAGTVGAWALIVLMTLNRSLQDEFNVTNNPDIMYFLRFAAIFLVGAVIFLYRERIPDSGWIAVFCTALFVAGLCLPNGVLQSGMERNPLYFFTASGLSAPLIAYPILWLGIHLPFQRLGARNDYSYGVYIYGYPVSQLVAYGGVQRWGFSAYVSACILATGLFAAASWWLIEKRALRLKKLDLPAAFKRVFADKREDGSQARWKEPVDPNVPESVRHPEAVPAPSSPIVTRQVD